VRKNCKKTGENGTNERLYSPIIMKLSIETANINREKEAQSTIKVLP
tara:strand:+ start:601 stop:741 length:141 start_codon:yes stop_codon:yes gene_type:complete